MLYLAKNYAGWTGTNDALRGNFFRDLNAQLTGLFFHDPLAIQRHQK
jgi:hypothetical protein